MYTEYYNIHHIYILNKGSLFDRNESIDRTTWQHKYILIEHDLVLYVNSMQMFLQTFCLLYKYNYYKSNVFVLSLNTVPIMFSNRHYCSITYLTFNP